jgi:hypothetical protein
MLSPSQMRCREYLPESHLERFGHAMTMTLVREVLKASERDTLAAIEPLQRQVLAVAKSRAQRALSGHHRTAEEPP